MKKINVRQIITIAAILLTIIVNVLANALPINGQNTGEISDRFSILFVPAGYVFSIWGLIYIFLIGFAIYQALPAQANNPRLIRAYPWVLLASVSNIAWIFAWHYKIFILTIVIMLVLLFSLVQVFLKLEIGKRKYTAADTWLVNVPFSTYLGWITVATIANATQVLFYLNWGGFGIAPVIWAIIMLIAAFVVGLLMAVTRGQPAYLLVLVWATIGIALKQAAYPSVAITAWVVAGLLTVAVVYVLVTKPWLKAK